MPSGAAQNLALDQELFRALEGGGGEESARAWQSTEAVVILGRSGSIARDVDADACAADGVEILKRESGGGAVLLGPGCVVFSLALSLERRPGLRDVRWSYRSILSSVIGALGVAELEIRDLSDLAIGDRKVSGNAQRRGAHALLHHGTLLCGLDPGLAQRYLKPPLRQPDYRRSRTHVDFMGSLPLSTDEIMERLSRGLRAIASAA